MAAARPTLTTTIIAAYWDLHRVLRTLWPLALGAFFILYGSSTAQVIVPRLAASTLADQMMLKIVIGVAGMVLMAPFLIATHRFVLLGEVTRRYAIEPANPRFRLFAGWLAVLWLVASIPGFLLTATTPSAPIYYVSQRPAPDLAQLFVLLAICVAVAVFLIRMVLMLPALAVDAPGAIWQNAMRDSSGNVWFIILASLLTPIPLVLLGTAAMLAAKLLSPAPLVTVTAAGLIVMAMIFIGMVLGVVIASRFYLALGDRLNQPLNA